MCSVKVILYDGNPVWLPNFQHYDAETGQVLTPTIASGASLTEFSKCVGAIRKFTMLDMMKYVSNLRQDGISKTINQPTVTFGTGKLSTTKTATTTNQTTSTTTRQTASKNLDNGCYESIVYSQTLEPCISNALGPLMKTLPLCLLILLSARCENALSGVYDKVDPPWKPKRARLTASNRSFNGDKGQNSNSNDSDDVLDESLSNPSGMWRHSNTNRLIGWLLTCKALTTTSSELHRLFVQNFPILGHRVWEKIVESTEWEGE